MFLRQSIISTNRIWKEIAVLECENAKIFENRKPKAPSAPLLKKS